MPCASRAAIFLRVKDLKHPRLLRSRLAGEVPFLVWIVCHIRDLISFCLLPVEIVLIPLLVSHVLRHVGVLSGALGGKVSDNGLEVLLIHCSKVAKGQRIAGDLSDNGCIDIDDGPSFLDDSVSPFLWKVEDREAVSY